MKAVILAGGFGTRISEESTLRPKPLVEIGGKPILWHIMKTYAAHGVNEFIICCGYKGYMIKDYFLNYYLHQSDITVDLETNETHLQRLVAEPWKVTLADTGESTMTGGRLKRVYDYVKDEDFFFFTYGDGVADIDVSAQLAHHKAHGKLATITAVQPPGRYGALDLDGDQVRDFVEKPRGDGGWINGGYFVLSPKVIDYIEDDATSWEEDPLIRIAHENQLNAYFHKGFWQPMDTLRDKNHLEELWNSGAAPWKV
jgi:glucose-1-phosphate cytidylyltransferase